jgi:spermidine/putrescine transport system ATP-binding protein
MTDRIDVELIDVVKRFGEVSAVDRVSLQIKSGEFFSLLGPSGCGKTTTLRLLAGFEQPTSGRIMIQGRDVAGVPAHHRNVNTVFQSYALFPHMTVEQNVAFGLEARKTPREHVATRVAEALELVRLKGFEARRPRQMSGGQQQRVALARALVNHPAVLLLDEPLGALDLKLRKEMQSELKSLQERVGITFIYVTHDQGEALTMSDRIAVMSRGKVLQCATPVEIYEHPNCRFVADFIGESNFLPGTVLETGSNLVTVKLNNGSTVRAQRRGDYRPDQTVSVAVRPERVRLSETASANGLNCISGSVRRIIYLGTATRYEIGLPDGSTIMVDQPTTEHLEVDGNSGTLYATWSPASTRRLAD